VVILSIFRLVFVTLHTVVIAPVVVALALVDERAAYGLCRLWVRINVKVCSVRIRRRRLAWLDPHAPYVFMSNHRSQYDIFAVVEALPEFQLRWVAKKELASIPFFGWALRRGGHIVVDRSDTAQAVASLRAAREKMAAGVSVVIFPEGTRAAPDETLLPFKKGGFMLALETGFPIVPIVVRGSDALLPRDSWRSRGGTIDVVVGSPIAVAGVNREQLMRQVADFMRHHLGAGDAAGAVAEAV
jgi:1-acyl-sn-glycerol-3-phosphate acyltransferase